MLSFNEVEVTPVEVGVQLEHLFLDLADHIGVADFGLVCRLVTQVERH